MGIYLDEPLAAMAATAFTIGGAVIGSWWQRRRGVALPPARRDETPVLEARFDRLEAIVEATAVEVERVAEGQRFTTKLLAEGTRTGNQLRPGSASPPEHHTPH